VTREQKLALIIGFSLILAVGVLISDHLSRAQSDTIVADQDIDHPMVFHGVLGVPPGIGETGRQLAGRDAVPLDPGIRGASSNSLPGIDTARSQTDTQSDINIPTEIATSSRTGSNPAQGGISIPGQSSFIPEQNLFADSGNDKPNETLELVGFEPVPGFPLPGISSRNDLGQIDQSNASLSQQIDRQETRQQAARTHKVSEGESLYGIASEYYGDGNLWPELAKANSDRVNAKGHVLIGVVLNVPYRGGDIPSVPAGPRLSNNAPTTAQKPTESNGYGMYTIKTGDTLSEISQELMGTMRRMNELIELNRDQINDADDIRVGMKLRYPRGQRA
jgi:LysM repeat protein